MSEKSLILRTCSSDMSSYGGFIWPTSGPVECPDWQPTIECGNGLHGALWGEGDGTLLSFDADAKWLVVEVDTADIVDLKGKVKFPRGVVVHCSDRHSATAFIQRPGKAVIGGTSTSGDRGTSTSGYGGTSTSGDGGTSTSGYGGIVQCTYYDNSGRRRIVTGYVGENGILPDVAYKCDENGNLVKAG